MSEDGQVWSVVARLLAYFEEGGEGFAGPAQDDLGEGRGVERLLGADIDGAGGGAGAAFCPVDEAGRGIDGSRGSDDKEYGAAVDFALDTVHFEGDLAEPDDGGADACAAFTVGNVGEGGIEFVILVDRCTAIGFAAGLVELAVHMDEVVRSGALVQVVYVLRAKEEVGAELLLECGEGAVRGIGLALPCLLAAMRVELPDEFGICVPAFGGGYGFDAIASPEAVAVAEGLEAAFGADARPGEDEDSVGGGDLDCVVSQLALWSGHRPWRPVYAVVEIAAGAEWDCGIHGVFTSHWHSEV